MYDLQPGGTAYRALFGLMVITAIVALGVLAISFVPMSYMGFVLMGATMLSAFVWFRVLN